MEGNKYIKSSTLYACLWGVISWGIWSPWHVWPVWITSVIYFQMWDFWFSACFREELYHRSSDDLDFYCQELCKHRYTIRASDSEVAYFEQCALYVSPPMVVCQLPTSCSLPFGFPSSQTAPGQSVRYVLPAAELCPISCCSQQQRQRSLHALSKW